jgi:hypothetical protein
MRLVIIIDDYLSEDRVDWMKSSDSGGFHIAWGEFGRWGSKRTVLRIRQEA